MTNVRACSSLRVLRIAYRSVMCTLEKPTLCRCGTLLLFLLSAILLDAARKLIELSIVYETKYGAAQKLIVFTQLIYIDCTDIAIDRSAVFPWLL